MRTFLIIFLLSTLLATGFTKTAEEWKNSLHPVYDKKQIFDQ